MSTFLSTSFFLALIDEKVCIVLRESVLYSVSSSV